MKRSYVFTLVVMLFTLSTFAQTYTIQFEKPQIVTGSDGFSVFVYENCRNYGREGAPELPYYGADYLMLPNHELSYIHIQSATFYPPETGIKVRPAVKPVPLSLYTGEEIAPQPDPAIYASTKPYPGHFIDNSATHFLCGHSIASFTICPVQYIPANDEVKFLQEITFEIGTLPTDRAAETTPMRKTSYLLQQRLQSIVRNPEMQENYSYSMTRDEEYDLLLITNNALKDAFGTYVEFKESTGYFVKVMSVEEIYGSYNGIDNQDKIRNCIKDYYSNHNTTYVILGGDGDINNGTENIIPPRGLIALDDDDIASDMYYAGLDGTWNTDNDGYWGEYGEWDLYSEVSIGRICVDNQQEISNFTNKLIKYQNAPVVADIEKGLMVGEQLNTNTWGGTYKEEIASGSSANGYTTVGFPANFSLSKLYEMSAMWYKEDIFEQFNVVGLNLLNHLGHSNVNYNMKMYNSDITTTNYTNDGINRGYVIGYSQGCYNGSFDNRNDGGGYGGEDCFAEAITNLATAEVGCIANSRYGWYNPGGTNSSSQYYDRQFFDAIFGQNITQIGDVNAQSKEKDISYIQDDEYCRWTAYELNLFGDPSMDIWTAVPTDIIASYPYTIPIGSSSIDVQTDAPHARVAITKNDVLIGRAIADANGDATVEFAMITDPAPLSVSIIAHNRNPHTGEVLVIANQPYLIFAAYTINDASGNGDGCVDYGENIYLSLTIKNVGDQPAYNTSVTLTTGNEFIEVIDNSQMYGLILAGESKTITDAFNFEVASDIPDQTLIHFDVSIVADDTWEDEVDMIACAPVLASGMIFFNDTTGGNASNSIDPGEEITVLIPAMNAGHSSGYNATATLTSTSEWVSIDEPFIDLGDLYTNTIMNLEFPIQVDDYAPIGSYIDLTLDIQCGDYSYQHTYTGMIGLIFENWETGDFSKFNWSTSSTVPFQTSMTGPYEGLFCVQSGQIPDEQSSNIKLTYNCVVDDSISFYRKISSEENADYLQFYIDNTLVDQWAGLFDWERFTYPVTAGVHTFKWVYLKNAAEIKGLDCAWIDFIVFPPTTVTTCYPGNDTTICEGTDFQCNAAAANYTSLSWETSGTGEFSATNTLDPIYYPSQADYNSGMVTLTLTAYSNYPCGDITRNLDLGFQPLPDVPPMPAGPEYVDLYYTTTSEYSTSPVENATGYSWLIDPENAGWISGNDTLATVQWNAEFLGDAEISVKSLNDCGESNFSESLTVTVDNTVGLGQYGEGNFRIHIIPNPSGGIFKLEIHASRPAEIELSIINAAGAILYHSDWLNVDKMMVKEFDLSEYPEGLYYLKIMDRKSSMMRKLVITK